MNVHMLGVFATIMHRMMVNTLLYALIQQSHFRRAIQNLTTIYLHSQVNKSCYSFQTINNISATNNLDNHVGMACPIAL